MCAFREGRLFHVCFNSPFILLLVYLIIIYVKHDFFSVVEIVVIYVAVVVSKWYFCLILRFISFLGLLDDLSEIVFSRCFEIHITSNNNSNNTNISHILTSQPFGQQQQLTISTQKTTKTTSPNIQNILSRTVFCGIWTGWFISIFSGILQK